MVLEDKAKQNLLPRKALYHIGNYLPIQGTEPVLSGTVFKNRYRCLLFADFLRKEYCFFAVFLLYL